MKKTIVKSLLLFVSIPLINSIAFALGTMVHTMYQSTITTEQFDHYQWSMLLMIGLTGLAIPTFETLYDQSKINNQTTNLLYLGLFVLIAILTFDQFSFRPYEHSLTFLSITSILFTRSLINKNLLVPQPA